MTRALRLSVLLSSALALSSARCGGPDEAGGPDDEWGMDGPLEPTPPRGKEDSEYRRGLLVKTDTTRTQVWTARNKWEDRDTLAARKAGLAWPADSGLNWDEKYARWIESLRWIPSVGGQWETVELTTPWGKMLPSPQLECAEMSLLLRIAFSAWHDLPLFLEAQDESGQRVYFGHNGVRTATGRYAQSPEFAISYRDTSATPPADPAASWPHDAKLRTRKLWGGEDEQPMVAPGAPLGAYLDEIHLNKRAGYFTVMALNYLGSVNLADTANTYNVVPEAVRAGDSLVERWQRVGIGHTLVVKEVVALGEGNLDVVTVSGSMPRRQAKRESGLSSKRYFTSDSAGGPGTNYEGDEYAKLGGGLKRWRVTKNIGGYWTNTWMDADEASWIDSTDLARIWARPARFEDLLGQVSPEQQRTELVAQIEDARRHLTQYPASCSARERRERAFEDLYDLGARDLDLTRAQIDTQYRTLADSVLAELVYGRSKTCCWNSTTAPMYSIVMDYAAAEQQEAGDACALPSVFMSQADGYRRWADFAEQTGRAAAWRAWTEDEPCGQRDAPSDTEAEHQGTPYCELGAGGGGCTDPFEPNDTRAGARAISGTVEALRICAGDVDWLAVEAAATVRIEFTHASGDLDVVAVDASGAEVGRSAGTSDSEEVAVPAGGAIEVFGYAGAENEYRVIVN
ncbi:MAG: hypothetical protein HYY06_32670 [Deltaproteobacteria bacterium]|nr:hypothetical protein [Deltaproteobacteria bacterium]